MTVSAMSKVYYSLYKKGLKALDEIPVENRSEVEYLISLEK